MADEPRPLAGKVALVAGATRGAGRGIAAMLGAAGARVYCVGRSGEGVAATPGRPETLEETAAMVSAQGGEAVAVRCDCTQVAEVEALAARIAAESGGLHVLVNDVWGGDALTDWSHRFWEIDTAAASTLIERAIFSHLLVARHATPLMLERPGALIVEVTDGEFDGYRGHIVYDLVKASVIRLAYAMAWDLAETGVTALALTPGFLRSEHVLDSFGVAEANWRDALAQDPFFEESETPYFIGRAIAALAADRDLRAKSGGVYHVADLADEYGFTDVDGRVPRFWGGIETWLAQESAKGAALGRQERSLAQARYVQIHRMPSYRDRARALAARLELNGLPQPLRPS
jgi:NAD(P)-dependent dehydrogenase (short-subunit alcohol dehydrogenase family)